MTDSPTAEKKSTGWFAFFKNASIFSQTAYVLGGIALIFVVALLLALSVGIGLGKSDGVADVVATVRDLFIILLALQGMVLCIAVMVLILQFAALLNLLQHEVDPIVKNLQDTSSTLKGTTDFLSENLVTPLIESKAWLTGISSFMKGAANLGKAAKPKKGKAEDEPKAEPPADT